MNEQLKKQMVIKLGTTTNDEAQIINNMVDSANAGALPEVSATDNGQVLTVANGVWAKAQPQGGSGGTLYVTTAVEGDDTVLSTTYADIEEAVDNGLTVVLKLDQSDQHAVTYYFASLYSLNGAEGSYSVTFNGDGYIMFESSTEDGVMIQNVD